jgi:hypothetical protein
MKHTTCSIYPGNHTDPPEQLSRGDASTEGADQHLAVRPSGHARVFDDTGAYASRYAQPTNTLMDVPPRST